MCAPILQPRRLWLLSHKRSLNMAYLPPSHWTVILDGWELPKAVTFPPPSYAFVTPWEEHGSSATRITPNPHGFVERSHRTLTQECLRREHPKTLDEVRQVTGAFATHSNWQRPHQGISCGNQPPRVAFPTLPSLPPIPDLVNPDAWLSRVKGQHLVRRVNRQGCVKVDLYSYSISSKLAGQRVTLSIQAKEQALQVVYPQEYRRSLPLKGLHQRALPYQEYLTLMQREASTQQRLLAMGRWKVRPD